MAVVRDKDLTVAVMATPAPAAAAGVEERLIIALTTYLRINGEVIPNALPTVR
jgi:hypothetical protein